MWQLHFEYIRSNLTEYLEYNTGSLSKYQIEFLELSIHLVESSLLEIELFVEMIG